MTVFDSYLAVKSIIQQRAALFITSTQY